MEYIQSSTYTGEQFNKIPHGPLIKLTNSGEIHKGYLYKDGLNLDHQPFNPTGSCEWGGLYFIELKYITSLLDTGEFQYMREVEIPGDALVYIDNLKFKTNKFKLKPRHEIMSHPLWSNNNICLEALKFDYRIYHFIANPTPEINFQAVKLNGLLLEKIKKNQTQELVDLAIQDYPEAIRFAENQYKTIPNSLIAVKKRAYY